MHKFNIATIKIGFFFFFQIEQKARGLNYRPEQLDL